MALLTPLDSKTLQNWGLDKDYRYSRLALIQVARIVYQAILGSLNVHPTPFDCEGGLARALIISTEFNRILNRQWHAPPILWPTFAIAMARLLLDNDWLEIVK
jgi:hypothetical protein